MTENEILYRALYRIRRFEETVLDNFPKGVFRGTTHAYLGQEANAVGVLSQLQVGDVVFSNHRCHGHYLAYGGDMRALFAEMMGRATGVCGGRGGSQHLHWGDFYSNGVQGGILPIATGMALAEKRQERRTITFCFLGDGTLGQGVVYESLNMAALWEAPALYIVENNQIAQTTPIEMALSGDIASRFNAFGIPALVMDSADVLEIRKAAWEIVNAVRTSGTPRVMIIKSCRFGPHSKGDDTRPSSEIEMLKARRDPLKIQAARLALDTRNRIEEAVDGEVASAFEQALGDPLPEIPQSTVFADPFDQQEKLSALGGRNKSLSPPGLTVLKSLNVALHQALASDERVIVMGEDILDPYGGAFKVTRGLSTAFPERVITTPISEAGIAGVAAGMALRGLRPVVEVMFGDFMTLMVDQVVNHIAKFRWMYNDQVRVPLVLRTPMGGRRGYGPTHSQTLEKLFLGMPGLKVVAACDLGDPGGLLLRAITDEDPVLFIENKLLYTLQVDDERSLTDFEISLGPSDKEFPVYSLKIKGAPAPVITMVAYGYMANLARQAVAKLAYENEVFAELIILTQLSPFDVEAVTASAMATGRVLTIEEGSISLGWGAEVISQSAEALGDVLKAVRRVAAYDLPVPASALLEETVLPGVDDIVTVALSMVI